MTVIPLHRGLLIKYIAFGLAVASAIASLTWAGWAFLPPADDWITFRTASLNFLRGEPVYGYIQDFAYYSNPPWLALILSPLAVVDPRLGVALLFILSLVSGALLARHYGTGLFGLALILLSPPMIYTLLHGQVDALILLGLLLPCELWPIIAMTKPQVSLGLVFAVQRSRIMRAFILTILVVLLSLLLFGNWILALLSQPAPFVFAELNILGRLWPFQVAVGAALIMHGIDRKDELILISASPFLSPYATMSSFLGIWLMLVVKMKKKQAALILACLWGAVIYRML